MVSQSGNIQSPSQSFPMMFMNVLKDFLLWGLVLATTCRVLGRFVDFGLSSVLVTIGVLAASRFLRKLSRWKSSIVEERPLPDLRTDSFSVSEGSEEETELMSREEEDGDVCGRDDWSEDGSITDEESLIEIAISSGHYIGRGGCGGGKEENVVEVNDENEEENLIEIDILIGSIKCNKP